MHVTHLFCASALLVATSAVSAEDSALAETPTVSAADREAWLADYAGLKTSMQQGYANLDWIVAHRGLDLADLDRKTIDRLAAAQSRADAATTASTRPNDVRRETSIGELPSTFVRLATMGAA